MRNRRQHPPQLVGVVLVCLHQTGRQVLHHIVVHCRLPQVVKQVAQQPGDALAEGAVRRHRCSLPCRGAPLGERPAGALTLCRECRELIAGAPGRLAGLRAAGARALLPSGAAVGAGRGWDGALPITRCWAGTGAPSSSAQRKLSASGAPHGGPCCHRAHQLRRCASEVADRSADRAAELHSPRRPSPFPCQRPPCPSRHAEKFLHRSLRRSGAPHRCCGTPTAAAAAAATARLLARGPPTCRRMLMPLLVWIRPPAGRLN